MSTFTQFSSGSLGTTVESALAVKMASLKYYSSALEQACQQINKLIEIAPKICEQILASAKDKYDAAITQGATQIAGGAVGLVGAGVSFVRQGQLQNELKTANQGVAINAVPAGQPAGGAQGQAVAAGPAPKGPRSPEEIRNQLQSEPNLWTHLSRSLGEALQGTGTVASAESTKAAAEHESQMKWLEAGQQTFSRFLELLTAQKQLIEQIMRDGQTIHSQIIQAAAARG